jgi:hypothetical protein
MSAMRAPAHARRDKARSVVRDLGLRVFRLSP